MRYEARAETNGACRNWKQLYPDLILDPERDPFPAIPAVKIAGVSICDSNVIPLIPTAAGTRHVAATMRTTGVQIAVSPVHLQLFNSFAAAVEEVVEDVSRRGRAATQEAMPGLLEHEDGNVRGFVLLHCCHSETAHMHGVLREWPCCAASRAHKARACAGSWAEWQDQVELGRRSRGHQKPCAAVCIQRAHVGARARPRRSDPGLYGARCESHAPAPGAMGRPACRSRQLLEPPLAGHPLAAAGVRRSALGPQPRADV